MRFISILSAGLLLAAAASATAWAQSFLPSGDLCSSVKIADIVQAARDNPNTLASAQGMLTSQLGTPKRITMLLQCSRNTVSTCDEYYPLILTADARHIYSLRS